ncbi:plasmid SOS inhibition protein A [Escherichia coli]|uniref:plasmid SOS inhibition protein A n=1 Tax=Escherichia coli TaxID=562 RepID=UPI001CCB9F26|nr:plasmid SOS inhibition protein A [Escherichia coli]UBM03959.1 plasmid SOS inhibition protein A [Escherichia coli]
MIPLSAEQQAAMQAVAVTEQRRRQGRTLSSMALCRFLSLPEWQSPVSLTDLRFFAPALTKEEFHGNRLLWLAAVDKLIESFGEVCVLPLPSDAGHRLFPIRSFS